MFAFRDAYEKHDANKAEDIRVDGERVISERSSIRRRGTDEVLLRNDLTRDLSSLVDTIDLASVTDLEGLEHVKKSIVNFGLYDLTHVILSSDATEEVIENLRRALLEHEPRLLPGSLTITRTDSSDDVGQRIKFSIRAEMMCKPLDVPVEFVAELDSTSGKVLVTQSGAST
jgi:type VI secretion system protein ImpF